MLQQINTTSGTAQIAAHGLSSAPTMGLVLAQLSAGNGEAALPASQMMNLLSSGDASAQLTSSLTALLQQPGSEAALAAGLTQLLAQYGGTGGQTLAPSIQSLASMLGMQLSQVSDEGSRSALEKQSMTLLRQLSQGNGSEALKQALTTVLQGLRQSGGPLTQTTLDDKLQTLLQQVRQDNGAQGQHQDLQFTRNVTEFALRLNQQIAEDAARQQMPGGQVTARQQGEQSRQQSQQQEEQAEEEEKSVQSVSSYSAASTPIAARSTTITVGGSSSSARSVSGTSGMSLYQGDSVFSYGLSVLFTFMQMLSEQANSSYADMQKNSTISRDAQGHASTIDGILANVAAEGNTSATGELPADVIKYIKENHLEISGVCGYGDDGEWKWTTEGKTSYDQGQLTAIKGALDNVANRASDFISTSQLQLQKMMQTYNVCVSLINSLQTMLADMNKTIAQGIR